MYYLPYIADYTMPQRPNDYVHRIGRVGRADRMGLAISLVGTYPEKVWYHQCPSRGEKCHNTALLENGGCAIWYNEMELVSVRFQICTNFGELYYNIFPIF